MPFRIFGSEEIRKDYFSRPHSELGSNYTYHELKSDKDLEKSINERIEANTNNLLKDTTEAERSAENYLMAANAGGALAIAGIIQKSGNVESIFQIKIPFVLFVFSITLVGLIKAVRIVRSYSIYGEWKKNSRKFYFGAISFEELLNRNSHNWRDPILMILPAILAYILFFIASTILIISVLMGAQNIDHKKMHEPEDCSNGKTWVQL